MASLQPMKAMVFAAGRGTRLKPLTDTRPKALVEVGGVTLLEHTLRRLAAAGVAEVIINLHHFGEQIPAFVEKHVQHVVCTPNQECLTRFLCGVTTPLLTKLKARQLAGFATLEDYPYAEVREWLTGL